jgi:phenylacetate-coenzyme A ligase PaaK-like adenylate-forming protein
MTEMGLGLAVDCPVCGLYHFNELDVLAEVVDPETGRALPPGSAGELVFTTLGREAMPFIRYRTRDLSILGEASATCGSGLRTISHVKSRIESLVHLQNGFVLYPTIFHDTMFSFPEIIDYEMSLDGCDGGELLTIDAEVHKADELLRRRIIDALRKDPSSQSLNRAAADIRVHFREPGSFRQGENFKKIITDRREKIAFQPHGLSERSPGDMTPQINISTNSDGRTHGN